MVLAPEARKIPPLTLPDFADSRACLASLKEVGFGCGCVTGGGDGFGGVLDGVEEEDVGEALRERDETGWRVSISGFGGEMAEGI